ncbi:MAG: TonB-dependent receptor domain-containing protein [Gammaproteobacteria bacterium]
MGALPAPPGRDRSHRPGHGVAFARFLGGAPDPPGTARTRYKPDDDRELTPEITKDNSGLQGNRLSNVPRHAGSLRLKYDHNGVGAREGLSLAIGVFAAGQREGDNENTFQLPGFARLDASTAYRLRLGDTILTAQLNVRNLLDKRYFESTEPNFVNAAPRAAIFPGAPLTVLGSIRLEY